MKLDFRQRLLASTLLATAGLIANPAYAQDAGQSTVPDQNQPTNPAAAPPTGPVEASPTPTVSSQGEAVQQANDIVVTGTRIPQPNLESAAPVTVVSNQDIKLTGTTRIEDALNQLPGAASSQSSGISNGATGTAEIDLRYLGSKRSLTLVNGRRLTPGDPNGTTQAGDINIIPASLLKRVEVLTGGASSVYGADAVAGVVNFIIDTDFTGLRVDGNWSIYQHNNDDPGVSHGLNMSDILNAKNYPYPTGSVSDGRAIDATVSLGASFDDGRGHALAYFGYRKINPILQGKRDYSSCVIQNTGGGVPRCGGSATANPGNALFFSTFNATTSTIGQLGPGTITQGAQNIYNFAPLNYFQRPDERYTAGAFANYEINSAVKPYLEFMFMDDHTLAQIAPSGDFGNTLTINCDNPLMSAAQSAVLCAPQNLITGFIGSFPVAAGAPYNTVANGVGSLTPIVFNNPTGGTYNKAFFQLLRRNTEGGPRISDLTHTSYRGVLGVRGDLSSAFSYDAYYQYGKTDYSQVYRNEFSVSRLGRALDVVSVDPATGLEVAPNAPGSVAECRSVLDASDPACVPYDVFGAGGPSAAAINYLNVFGVIHGKTSEQIADANITGDLGELGFTTPWATDGVGVNAGWEYRKESLTLDPDQSFQTNDLAGQGSPTLPVNGDFHVNELFGEIQIPLVQHNFVDDLSLGAGYRKSWYKLSNGRKYDTDTYKLTAEFAPIADIRFRGSYNRAVRAPNIQELFAPAFVGLDGSVDPCAGHQITATDYGCIAQGMTVGAGTPANPAGQYNGLLGGNENLEPEKATTKTVGVVLQPRFFPRFAFTVDYWNIDLKNAIQGFGADAIINTCVANTTATSVSPACALVHRNAAGSIWLTSDGYVIDTPNNQGRIKTDGFDFNMSYSHRLGGLGGLSASFNGTLLKHYKVQNGLSDSYDCAGLYGPVCSGASVASSSPMPKWRHKARLTWDTPLGLGLSVQWRYFGKVKAETLEASNTINGANNFDPGLHVKAQNYFDLAATYSLWDMVSLRAGVNNVFDKDPPLITSGNAGRPGSNLCPAGPCNGNTYPGAWDALGRYIFAGATVDFKHKPTPLAPPPVIAPPPPPPAAPATITCPDGLVILANQSCPALPPPPPPPAPAPERGQ
jgi:outer membrane receptor protein involved in Fe transport